jgi:hypothetical protein
MRRPRRSPLLAVALCAASLLAAQRAGARSELDYATLMSGSFPQPVDFAAFAPDADATAATNPFSGVLRLRFGGTLPHHTLLADPAYVGARDLAAALTWPADFAYEFVQDGAELVPVRRGAIPGRHRWWELILEPGRVWNEPGDHGLTRAAIPFALQERNANCTHNGVLMFLFGADGTVSRTAMQVASETCLYLHLDLWALLQTQYRPAAPGRGASARSAQAVLAYRAERAARLPRRSLAQLRADHPQLDIDALAIGAAQASTIHGLVVDGVNYMSACATRSGDYPYCDELDLPSYSLAKSLFAATALMRLQADFPQTRSQLLSTHVPQCHAPAWAGVSFVDALDMATGNYDSDQFEADELDAKTAGLFLATDHRSKIAFACGAYPHRAPPGTRWVYHTSDTYLLGTALAHYLRGLPGHEHDDLYRDLVHAQIYAPLQLSATTAVTRRSYDAVAQPFTGWGLTFNPGDIARLGLFYGVDHGAIDGRPVLDAEMLDQALQRDEQARGLPVAGYPDLRYQHGFWARNLRAVLGCAHDTWVPFMSGFGGISVVLFPNGVVYYNFADDALPASFDWAVPAREARKLGDFCR